jgi:hypothetical protein
MRCMGLKAEDGGSQSLKGRDGYLGTVAESNDDNLGLRRKVERLESVSLDDGVRICRLHQLKAGVGTLKDKQECKWGTILSLAVWRNTCP